MRTCVLGAVLTLGLSTTAQARFVELTFDDGESGTGVASGHASLNNMEALRGAVGVEPATTQLVGNAVRGPLNAGRYGRAADFPDGGGYIEIKNLTGVGATPVMYLWVKATDLSQGTLLEAVGVYRVLLDHGTVVLEAARQLGLPKRIPFGVFPTDGAFHHVTILLDLRGATPLFTVMIDKTRLTDVSTALLAPQGIPELRVGEGLRGSIDELLLDSAFPGPLALFDRAPDNCPGGFSCLEEVFTMTPAGFPHPVPVRFKSVYDPTRCSAATPCPLLFDVSGGSDCADDYAPPVSVAAFADAGFFVVTPDVYCEASPRTSPYPTETSQFIAIKEQVTKLSPLKALIKSGAYTASGCSHGAGAVTVWALHEADHPARTYARSPGLDALCVLAGGIACPAVTERNEARLIEALGSLDWNNPQLQAMQNKGASADQITEAVARSQDLALSWGVNTDGPVCHADGNYACTEEGLWGMRWGGARFRDVWKMRELAAAPTGYFVEDRGADCRHCASEDSEAFKCGLCLLKHGRAAMASKCGSCLAYPAGSSIQPGPPGEQCVLEASWYTDPLAGRDGGTGAAVTSTLSPRPGLGCDASPSAGLLGLLILALRLSAPRPATARGSRRTRSGPN